MKKHIYLCFLLLSVQGVAQSSTDSLWRLWRDASLADTLRLKALQALAWETLYQHPDSALRLATLELHYAEEKNLPVYQGKALNVIGSAYNIKGDLHGAMLQYRQALHALEKAGDQPRGVAAVCNNLGLIFRTMGLMNQALTYYSKDLEIQEQLADQNGIANAYNNLGNLYDDLGEPQRALEYYRKSMDLLEHSGDPEGLAIASNNVASMHVTLKNYRLALEYYLKSLKIRETMQDQRGIAVVYSNLGQLCQQQKLFYKAREYFQQSMEIQEKMQDKKGLITNWYNLGILLQEQGQYTAALPWCEKSLLASRETGMLRAERNACHCLYTAYKSAGQPAPALNFHEQYLALNDSLEKENTTQRLERLEFEKQVIADSLGKEAEKRQLTESYQNTLNWYLVAGIVVLLLALVFLARMLYFRQRSERLQSKTRLLEKQQLINEIDLLRTQVNPHFLFNSLSILSSLVHVNPDLSEQFIDRLSKSYRYILDQKDQTLVTLRTEVDFIQSYAFLLKIRFENKFDLLIQLDEPALSQWKIAPLTLQLLVENAVKHNRMSSREPLLIRVCLEADTLVVSNALRPRQQVEYSTGMGLYNIIHRYELLCDRPVRAGEIAGDFVVKIPMIK